MLARLLYGCALMALWWSCAQAQTCGLTHVDTIWGAAGVADIDITPEGVAFFSCLDQSAASPRGAVYACNLESATPELRDVTVHLPFRLAPMGLSYYAEGPNKGVLWVAHRGEGQASIEKFGWDGARLTHLASFKDPLLVTPHDVTALDADRFFATNEHEGGCLVARAASSALRLRKGNIVRYDGAEFRVAARRLGCPTGVRLSAERQRLFVTSVFQKRLAYYRLDASGRLIREGQVKFGAGAGRLTLDSLGQVWVTTRPDGLHFVKKTWNASRPTPWQLHAVRLHGAAPPQVHEVYRSRPDDISGAGVVAFYKQYVIIGSRYERFALRARLPVPASHANIH